VLGQDRYPIEPDGLSPVSVFPGRKLELVSVGSHRMAAGRMKLRLLRDG